MASKRHKPEEIVAKLRQVDVLTSQGTSVADAIRQIGGELLFVFSAPRRFALCRAMLAQCPAGTPLGNLQGQLDLLDTGAPARGAQKFPRDASCRMSLSSVKSATARRSRWFSRSSSFIRRT